jgi:hypothetical protein
MTSCFVTAEARQLVKIGTPAAAKFPPGVDHFREVDQDVAAEIVDGVAAAGVDAKTSPNHMSEMSDRAGVGQQTKNGGLGECG